MACYPATEPNTDMRNKTFSLTLLLLFPAFFCFAQSDTLFWFVAPEVDSVHGDRPIYLRMAAFGQNASIVVDQPANAAFTPITGNIAAGGNLSVNLTPFIDGLENKPADQVLNKGLRIRSNVPITAYYEVLTSCNCNPEIFTLKGKNAIGTSFLTPFQNFLPNSPNPVFRYSAFDIVATEDNTDVTITPTKNIVGHAANVPFTITLQKGETYSARATGGDASLHLGGSSVVSTKPVAITIKDDTVSGAYFGGNCADLLGDQIVPLNVIGTRYIAVRGFLSGNIDKLIILATQDNTQITINGNPIPVTTLSTAQTYIQDLAGNNILLESTHPVYVLHLSGFGCELGHPLLPPVECTGSVSVSVVRSTTEFFGVMLLTRNGNQSHFSLNGNPGTINPAVFIPVPGTNGEWVTARIDLSAVVPSGTNLWVTNSAGKFHLGIIHGGAGTGCRYGYFSNYDQNIVNANATAQLCAGDDLLLHADSLPGYTYHWTGPDGFQSSLPQITIPDAVSGQSGLYILTSGYADCPIFNDTLPVAIYPHDTVSLFPSICAGENYQLPNGNTVSTTGLYPVTLQSSHQCDSTVLVHLSVYPEETLALSPSICAGEIYTLPDGSAAGNSGDYTSVLSTIHGCDSTVHVHLTVISTDSVHLAESICQGESYVLPDGIIVVAPGVYTSVLSNVLGCDSTIVVQLSVNPPTSSTANAVICAGETYTLPSGDIVSTPGTYATVLVNHYGCDSLITTQLDVEPAYQVAIDTAFCEGTVLALPDGSQTTTSGVFSYPFQTVHGCDSTVMWTVDLYPAPHFTLDLPEGDTIYLGQTVEVEATLSGSGSPPYTYQWQYQGQATGGQGLTEIVTPEDTVSWLTLQVSDAQGCSSTDSILLVTQATQWKIPSAFTPNHDGVNDLFRVILNGPIVVRSFRIFNRWGTQVYALSDDPDGWDGTVQGREAPSDTYLYQLIVADQSGKEQVANGDFLLLR